MHVSLYVSDIAKTIKFYNLFFRQEPVKIRKGYTKYLLHEPALIISFVEPCSILEVIQVRNHILLKLNQVLDHDPSQFQFQSNFILGLFGTNSIL